MSFRSRNCTALLACLTVTPLLLAQNPTATMVGTVRDQSGAIVVGAALEIRDTDSGNTRKAVADQRGEFTVPDLAPGPYEVTITHAGFRTVRQTDIRPRNGPGRPHGFQTGSGRGIPVHRSD